MLVVVILRWECWIWLTLIERLNVDLTTTLFSLGGQIPNLFLCPFPFLRCSFNSNIYICPFCILSDWLDWSFDSVGIAGDGGWRRGFGQRSLSEAHQCLSWYPIDIRIEYFRRVFHTTRNLCGFKMDFYGVLEWPSDPNGLLESMVPPSLKT